MADPYLQKDGLTLKNLLGIEGLPEKLASREAFFVALRTEEVSSNGFPDLHGKELLKAIHHSLFQDVYELGWRV